jgi:hypothetical protein
VLRVVVPFFTSASLIFTCTLHRSAQSVAGRLTQQNEAPGSASGSAGPSAIAAGPVRSGRSKTSPCARSWRPRAKQTADLEQQKQVTMDKLNALIAGLSFDWSVTEN